MNRTIVLERFATDRFDPPSTFEAGVILRENGTYTEYSAFTCRNIEERYLEQAAYDEYDNYLQSEEEYADMLRRQDIDDYLENFEEGNGRLEEYLDEHSVGEQLTEDVDYPLEVEDED